MADATQIVVIGSSNTDMVVRCRRLPRPGETVAGGEFLMTPGGKGANQAVAAARLGAAVRFVGKVGRDAMGDGALANFARHGVDTSYVVRDESRPSGVALIMVDERGENLIAVASGANMALTAGDVEAAAAAFDGARVVVAQLEVPVAAIERGFQVARGRGVQTVLNAAPAGEAPDSLLAVTDYLIVNETEARMLAPGAGDQDRPEALGQALLARGRRAVVITLGSAGAYLASVEESRLLPSYRVKVVDTTGAGDAFVGGFAFWLALGHDAKAAAWYGNAVAALATTKVGAQSALPDQRAVQRFLITGGTQAAIEGRGS